MPSKLGLLSTVSYVLNEYILFQVVHDADTIGQELIGSPRLPDDVRLTVTLEQFSAEAWNS